MLSMKISYWLTHDLKKLHTKDRKKLSLYARVMHQIPLLLRFKIDSKVFSFKTDFINKSCRSCILVSNKTGLAIFGFFYNLQQILQASCFAHMK
jgi:hypothetical protein